MDQCQKDTIIRIISKNSNNSDNFVEANMDKSFHSLGMDSLDVVEVILDIEEAFNIEINSVTFESIDNTIYLIDEIDKQLIKKEK